jgi:hypothetical protein
MFSYRLNSPGQIADAFAYLDAFFLAVQAENVSGTAHWADQVHKHTRSVVVLPAPFGPRKSEDFTWLYNQVNILQCHDGVRNRQLNFGWTGLGQS